MKQQNPASLNTSNTIKKKKITTEILFIQKNALSALLAGIAVSVFCLFLFKLGKFDGEKVPASKGAVYSYMPQLSYQERKSYLYRKALKIGLIVWLAGASCRR